MAKTRRRRPANRTKRRPPTRDAAPRLGESWQAAPTRTYVRPSRRARRQTMIRAGIAGGTALGFLIAVFAIVGGGNGGDSKLVSRPVSAKVLSPAVKFKPSSNAAAADVGTGDQLREGAVVETDETGLGEFHYADGSLLRVGPGSSYTLDKARSQGSARDIVGQLATGKTWHRVTPKDADYSVKVLGATGTVVGTSVSVVCPTETDCFYTVVKGKMKVEDAAKRSAELEAGDQVEVKFGRLDPVKHLTPEELASDPWIAQNLLLDGESVAPVAATTTTVEGDTTTTLLGIPGETTIPGIVTGATTRATTRPSGGGTPSGTSPPGTSPPATSPPTTTATTQPPAPTTTAAPTTTTRFCDRTPRPPQCPPPR